MSLLAFQSRPPMSENNLPKMTFIVGAPRSGSTVLLDFLTVPKSMAWIPQKLAEQPKKLSLACRANKLNWPLLGEFFLERRSEWKSVPEPARGQEFWMHYLSKFTSPEAQPNIPGPGDLQDGEAEKLREAIKDLCHYQHRTSFVAEYNGFPRIQMMRAVFPKARFIQVLRDPRSVAYQMVKRGGGANIPLWQHWQQWKSIMPEALQNRLEELPESPLNFCGVLVRWYHDLYKQEMEKLPEEDRHEVAYSDLLARPEITLNKVMKFMDLEMNTRFKYYVKFHDVHSSNQRTNRNLNSQEADELALAVSAS